MAKKDITTYPEAESLQNFNAFGFNSETGAGENLPGRKIQEAIGKPLKVFPVTYIGDNEWQYPDADDIIAAVTGGFLPVLEKVLTAGYPAYYYLERLGIPGVTQNHLQFVSGLDAIQANKYVLDGEWNWSTLELRPQNVMRITENQTSYAELMDAIEKGKTLVFAMGSSWVPATASYGGGGGNPITLYVWRSDISVQVYVIFNNNNWNTAQLSTAVLQPLPKVTVSPGTTFHPRNEGAYIGGEDTKAWFYGPSGESYTMVGLVADHDITLLPGAKLELTLDGSPYINGNLPVYMALAVYDTPDTAAHDYWHYFHIISKPMEARTLYGMRNGLVNQGTPSLNPIVFEVDLAYTIKAGTPLFVLFGVRGEDVASMNAETLFADTCVGEDSGRYDPACFVSSLYYGMAQGTRLITEGVGFAAGLKFGFKASGSGTNTPKAGYTPIGATYNYFQIVIKKAGWLDSDVQEIYLTIKPIPQHLKLIARS